MKLSSAVFGGVLVLLVTVAAVIGGLGVIVSTKQQSKRNYVAITDTRRQAEVTASVLRIMLAVTGCTETDTPEQCHARIVAASREEGVSRIVEVDCRIRRALEHLPPPAVGERCSL